MTKLQSRHDGARDTLGDILTVAQAAERLQLSETTVYRMCKRGELPVVRLGRSWRVDAHRLDKLFSRTPQPARG